MSDDLVTDLAHLAGHLEQAADPAAAREAILIRKAIQAITGLTDELLPYRVFHSDAKSYDKIGYAQTVAAQRLEFETDSDIQAALGKQVVPVDRLADPEPNAQIEGAPV